MIKILELFGGIGACSKALERLDIEYEIADYVEIDKYAVKSFNAMHETNFEPQDICKWAKDIEVDLIMHGSPCQDFSVAGKQQGGDEGSGTRSSLMYETLRIVEKLNPKYVIWENVKNVISKKHIHNFNNYITKMNELGYTSYYQVLNAKDYGIPQNRERVFTISIRNDIDTGFVFPKKQELKLRLKDMLEDEVDEKYYLSEKTINYILDNNDVALKSGRNINNKTINSDIARTICCRGVETNQRADISNFVIDGTDEEITVKEAKLRIKNNTKIGDAADISFPNGYGKGTRVHKDIVPCLAVASIKQIIVKEDNMLKGGKQLNETIEKNIDKFKEGKILDMDLYNRSVNENLSQTLTEPNHNKQRLFDGLRIRKLTPKECWRLMGFDDEDFERASKVNSNTQLYKQAGNSIVVNVLEAILTNLLLKPIYKNDSNLIKGQTTIFDFI